MFIIHVQIWCSAYYILVLVLQLDDLIAILSPCNFSFSSVLNVIFYGIEKAIGLIKIRYIILLFICAFAFWIL